MKDRKLAVRYARALLSVLRDDSEALAADRFLSVLAQALDRDAAFRQLMLDPAVPTERRRDALRVLVERAALPITIRNFLDTMVANNRTAALPSIATVFREVREEAAGIVPAEIVTAAPMSDDLRSRAGTAIEKLTGRKVRLTCTVDDALIGGVVTRIGSTVYDGSLRTQLGQLRRRMIQE